MRVYFVSAVWLSYQLGEGLVAAAAALLSRPPRDFETDPACVVVDSVLVQIAAVKSGTQAGSMCEAGSSVMAVEEVRRMEGQNVDAGPGSRTLVVVVEQVNILCLQLVQLEERGNILRWQEVLMVPMVALENIYRKEVLEQPVAQVGC